MHETDKRSVSQLRRIQHDDWQKGRPAMYNMECEWATRLRGVTYVRPHKPVMIFTTIFFVNEHDQ